MKILWKVSGRYKIKILEKISEDTKYKIVYFKILVKYILEDTFAFTCFFVCLCILHVGIKVSYFYLITVRDGLMIVNIIVIICNCLKSVVLVHTVAKQFSKTWFHWNFTADGLAARCLLQTFHCHLLLLTLLLWLTLWQDLLAVFNTGLSSRVVSASDCSVKGPRFESRRWQLCLSWQLLRYIVLSTGCAPFL